MAEAVYSRKQIEQWQQKLEAIASVPRTTFTKKQVVEELIDTIEKALETRSYLEVADGLKDWGLDISEGSLKQYVSRYRKTHRAKAASSSRKRTTKAAAPVAKASTQTAAKSDAPKAAGKNAKALPEKPVDVDNEFNL